MHSHENPSRRLPKIRIAMQRCKSARAALTN
jgi:hypothetical protein